MAGRSVSDNLWADLQAFRRNTLAELESLRARVQSSCSTSSREAPEDSPWAFAQHQQQRPVPADDASELRSALDVLNADVRHKYRQLLMVAFFSNAYDYKGLCRSVRARRRTEDANMAHKQLQLQQSMFGGAHTAIDLHGVTHAPRSQGDEDRQPVGLLQQLAHPTPSSYSSSSLSSLTGDVASSRSENDGDEEEDEDNEEEAAFLRMESMLADPVVGSRTRGPTLGSIMSGKRSAPSRETVDAFKRRLLAVAAEQQYLRKGGLKDTLTRADELGPHLQFAAATRDEHIEPGSPVKAITRTELLAQINQFMALCEEPPVGKRDDIWTMWFLREFLGLTTEELDSSRKLLVEERKARIDQAELALRVRVVAMGSSADTVLAAYIGGTRKDRSAAGSPVAIDTPSRPADATHVHALGDKAAHEGGTSA